MSELLSAIFVELRGAWRYRWVAVVAAWLVSLVGWVAIYAIPDSFESSARVYVDTTSALDPLLREMTVGSNVLDRVEQVTTAMLGRPQLERVARETDLHLRAESSDELDGILVGLRQRTSILNDRRGDPNLYTITYRDNDPATAQIVVNKLLNIFVEDSLGESRVEAQKAQAFLREQLEELDAELSTAEQNLADFKRANVGRMPGEGGDYFARLQAEMLSLEDTRREIRVAVRRQNALQEQLSGESPTVDAGSGPQSDLDRRIEDNEQRLEELQLRFTDRHPEVIAIKEVIAQLEDQKASELAALRDSGGVGVASDNPVFQSIQIELANVNVEIASLRQQESDHTRKISEYQSLIDVLPQVEAELTRLTRDYDVKQAQYRSLLQRLEMAELSESREQSEDIKFRVIDPPVMPDTPVAPNRPLVILLVLIAGLGGGGVLAYLLNQVNPVFHNSKGLREATGLPVLGTIQVMRTAERRYWRKKQVFAFGSSLTILCGIFILVLVFHEQGSQALQGLV